MSQSKTQVPTELLGLYTKLGASYVREGVKDLTEFVKRIKSDLGDVKYKLMVDHVDGISNLWKDSQGHAKENPFEEGHEPAEWRASRDAKREADAVGAATNRKAEGAAPIPREVATTPTGPASESEKPADAKPATALGMKEARLAEFRRVSDLGRAKVYTKERSPQRFNNSVGFTNAATSRGNKRLVTLSTFARIIAAGLLFWAIARHGYDYFTILRWITCGVASYTAYVAVSQRAIGWTWTMAAIVALFNPLIIVTLSRQSWMPVDVATGLVLLVSVWFIQEEESRR